MSEHASVTLNLRTSLLTVAAPALLEDEDDYIALFDHGGDDGKRHRWSDKQNGTLFAAISKYKAHMLTKGMKQSTKWALVLAYMAKSKLSSMKHPDVIMPQRMRT